MKQRLRKLSGHAQTLLDAFLGLRLNYALLRPLIGDADAQIAALPRGHLQFGLPALRTTLLFACILDVVKLSWDDDDRVPSVANLIAALRDPALVRVLRAAHGDSVIIPREPADKEYEAAFRRIDDDRRASQINQFDAVHERVLRGWEDFEALPFKTSLVTLRDKHIAHLEVRFRDGVYSPVDIESLGLRRGDLGAAISRLEGIVRDLTEVFRMSDFQMSSATEMFDHAGESFWLPVRAQR